MYKYCMGTYFADQYSLLHFATGVIFYFFGITLKTSIILHILFEIIENTEQGMALIGNITFWPGGKIRADTLENSIGDIVFFIIGWYIAYSLDSHIKGKNK